MTLHTAKNPSRGRGPNFYVTETGILFGAFQDLVWRCGMPRGAHLQPDGDALHPVQRPKTRFPHIRALLLPQKNHIKRVRLRSCTADSLIYLFPMPYTLAVVTPPDCNHHHSQCVIIQLHFVNEPAPLIHDPRGSEPFRTQLLATGSAHLEEVMLETQNGLPDAVVPPEGSVEQQPHLIWIQRCRVPNTIRQRPRLQLSTLS